MEQEVCLSAPEALDLTVQRHYSALVIDFDLPGAAMVARMARLAPARRRPVILGMIGAQTEISETFQAGANFIIYKPLGARADCPLLAGGPRVHASRPETITTTKPGIAGLSSVRHRRPSGDGARLEPERPGAAGSRTVAPVQQVPLRFVLPGTTQMVEGMGEVIWADDGGRAGMLFSRLTPASRKYLKQWFVKRDGKKKAASRPAVRAEKRAARPPVSTRPTFLPIWTEHRPFPCVLDSTFSSLRAHARANFPSCCIHG